MGYWGRGIEGLHQVSRAATAMKQLVLSSHALPDVSSEPYFFDADEFGSGTTGKQLQQQQLGSTTTDELRPAPPPRPKTFSDVPLPPPERPLKWNTKLVGSHSSMRSRCGAAADAHWGREQFQPYAPSALLTPAAWPTICCQQQPSPDNTAAQSRQLRPRPRARPPLTLQPPPLPLSLSLSLTRPTAPQLLSTLRRGTRFLPTPCMTCWQTPASTTRYSMPSW